MDPKFTYDDMVIVNSDTKKEFRPGAKAWIIGVYCDRSKEEFSWLPDGVIYSIEFEDGESVDVNEDILTLYEDSD